MHTDHYHTGEHLLRASLPHTVTHNHTDTNPIQSAILRSVILKIKQQQKTLK